MRAKWVKPDVGWFKVNCDDALNVERVVMGGVILVRDWKGDW